MRFLTCAALISCGASLVAAWLTQTFLIGRFSLLGSFVGLQLSYNQGVAFGVHLGAFQEIIVLAAIVGIFFVAVRSTKTSLEQVGFGLILGGGTANIIDRLIDGTVTDMIQIGSFPIFNMADVSINVGIGILLFGMILQMIRDAKVRKKN